MSKICDRNYADNAMLSIKVVDGFKLCPSCEQPASCHQQPVDFRVLYWSLCGETGTSSLAIARNFCGITTEHGFSFSPPSDRDDRRRCIKLLELIPEWIPLLDQMVKYDIQEKETGIVINSSGVSAYDNSWSKQILLIREEGKL